MSLGYICLDCGHEFIPKAESSRGAKAAATRHVRTKHKREPVYKWGAMFIDVVGYDFVVKVVFEATDETSETPTCAGASQTPEPGSGAA